LTEVFLFLFLLRLGLNFGGITWFGVLEPHD
jgi:hypothetical protein